MSTSRLGSRRNRRIAAIAAGVLVIGVGATYTLASWTDSEWVWGGAGNAPGIGTSEFEVEQNRSTPFSNAASWENQETNPGGGLTFTVGALALTPGDSVYAPVALRTAPNSVEAQVQLNGAVAATGVTVDDDGGALWDAIRVSVYTETTDDETSEFAPSATCNADIASASGWTKIVDGQPLNTAASAAQTLDADSGSVQHYCFEVTLPAGSPDTLQGRTIAPAWEFASESQ